jgi:hypothetical protein
LKDRRNREAEADKLRLTPQYLKMTLIQALYNNTKIYFGESIPKMMMNLDQPQYKQFFEEQKEN